jgi:hypothetical protein
LQAFFDNATTTYPLSVVAAVFMLANWRGLHGALLEHCGSVMVLGSSYLFDSVAERAGVALEANCVLAIAGVEFGVGRRVPAKISATVDATAFIFDTPGSLHPVYLITVCLAWIKGVASKKENSFASPCAASVMSWNGLGLSLR